MMRKTLCCKKHTNLHCSDSDDEEVFKNMHEYIKEKEEKTIFRRKNK